MIVEGPLVSGFPPRAQGTRGHSLAMASTSSSVKVASATLQPPIYRSVVAPKRVEITVKIVKARMKMLKKGSGNPEFESLSEMYVELTEATANARHRHGSQAVGDRILYCISRRHRNSRLILQLLKVNNAYSNVLKLNDNMFA